MADTYYSKLTDAVDVPDSYEGVTAPLGDLLENVAYHGSTIDVTDPAMTPSPDPEELVSEEEWLVSVADAPPEEPEPPFVPETPVDEDEGVEPFFARAVTFNLEALSDIEVRLPIIDAVRLVVNPGVFQVKVAFDPTEVSVTATVALAVRFDRSVLSPVRATASGGFEVDETAPDVQIDIASASIRATSSGTVDVDGGLGLRLTRPAMIGNTGVIIESADITLNLTGNGDRPVGAPADWKGILLKTASVRVPSVFSGAIVADKLGFGSGGVTGTIGATFPTPDLTGKILGLTGGLKSVSIKLQENIPVEGRIAARVFLPFFEFPDPFDIDITIGIDGTITATISGDVTLERDDFAIFKITSLTIGVKGGVVFTALSGSLKPTIGNLDWPTFEVKEIRVDSNGNVSVGGGWIDLPSQKTLNLYSFTVEITKIGFGTEEDGDRWIGFSGGVKIADGVKAGASVKGLRIIWQPGKSPDLSLEGVGVELEIPNAIALKGSVSLTGTEFRGAVTVTVIPASLTIEGQFVSGNIPITGEKFFAILLRGELPAGIPLGATGLAFYGFTGLYAQNMKPDKGDQEDWYENPDGSPGWYLRGPEAGVGELDKWKGAAGNFAFGAGVTLGTFSDNGYQFSGRLLLVLTFPGPRILIDGRANLFKKRAELDGDEPNFRTFAVIDPEKSVLVNVDARYKYDEEGSLADLHGSAEAFFDFNDADAWHIFVGRKDPPSKRVGGTIFQLFNVHAYLEITPKQVAWGSGWSYDKAWTFGSLGVHLGASFSTDAVISWHPNHFTGGARFTGVAEATAFGRGVGITVDTSITGDVFDPMHLKGDFFAGINLPWPLPDFGATVTLEWQEPLDAPPPLPLPLREVTVEHHKLMLKWPIRRGEALRPNNNDGSGDLEFPADRQIGSPEGARVGVPDGTPSVPADSRIGLTFSRPIDDPAKIGGNPTLITPEYIGNPVAQKGAYTVQYTLASVALEKRAPAVPPSNDLTPQWIEIARAEGTVDQTGIVKIAGSWAPIPPDDSHPEANAQQLKLLINAKTPFEYTSQTRQVWDAWVEDRPSDYPCQPPALDPYQQFCNSFVNLQPPLPPTPKTIDLVNPAFKVTWPDKAELTVSSRGVPGTGSSQALGVSGVQSPGNELLVAPARGTNQVLVRIGTVQSFPGIVPTKVVEGEHSGNSNTVTMDAVVVSLFDSLTPADADTPGPTATKIPRAVSFDTDGAFRGAGLTEITIRPPGLYARSFELKLKIVSIVNGHGGEGVAQMIWFDENGQRAGVVSLPVGQPIDTRRIRSPERITRVAIFAGGDLHARIYDVHARLPVSAIAVSADGSRTFGPFFEVDEPAGGLIDVRGENIGVVKLGTVRRCEFTLEQMCVPDRRVDLTRHTFTSLQRLTQEDEMFEPQAHYRLVVTTRRGDHTTGSGQAGDDAQIIDTDPDPRFVEQAYFHVVGPPGLEVPSMSDVPADVQEPVTGLEDLRFYLKSTVPVSEPQVAGKPVARAHYRAYDVAMSFNEASAVEKMYRLAHRDLTLRLFDATNAPVLDADGRAIIPATLWDRDDLPTITEATSRWIRMINRSACRPADVPVFDETQILGDQKIAGPVEALLAPETLYQARLVPALLHETFSNPIAGLEADGAFELERWKSENFESESPKWVVVAAPALQPDGQPVLDSSGNPVLIFFASEQFNREATLLYRGPLAAPNNADSPNQWTDFRGSVQLRWPTGTVGVDLRRTDSGDRLRIAFDRSAGTRQITATAAGATVFTQTDPVNLGSASSDLVVSFEVVGRLLRVGQGTDPPIDVQLPAEAPSAGAIGLYARHALDCLFTEVRVDDLRSNPSTAQRLDFVSSKYSNFAHHLGSFDDQVFKPATGLGIVAGDLDARLADAVTIPFSTSALGLPDVTDAERRAFDALEEKIIGAGGVLRAPERLEIIRASHDETLTAVLIRSPEPLRWERTVLTLSESPESPFLGIPGDVKLLGVTLGPTPATKNVILLIRNRVSLSGFSLEWRPLPDPNNDPDPAWQRYYSFGTEPAFADGTQVFVFSGVAADAPPREPATVQRFLATDPTQAQLHFASPGVEIRLRNPAGDVVHHRGFNETIAFTGQDAKAFRKLDGTGLVLFREPPPTSPPAQPLMRLSFVFTRNLGDAFPIMREAGSDTAERVVLDLDVS